MKLITANTLIDDITIKFDTVEECVELKNRLIAFIKSKKRDIRDKGIEPELTFNITKQNG